MKRLFDSVAERTVISKGWSDDQKYRVVVEDGRTFLLRISPFARREHRKLLFDLQKKVAETGIPMCYPLECGECEEGFYTLQSWVDGADAEDVIPWLSEQKQYRMGWQSGQYLKRIHEIPAPLGQPEWGGRFNEKINRKIQRYLECPLKFDGAESIIKYINANRFLLADRPQCFQHGDYHIGNMMVENDSLVIIDFDRYDFGDPWEEFNRIVWCAQKAPIFATGMVDGYFDGAIPTLFWRLLALYIGSNTLSSVSWAISYGEEETNTMLQQAKDVLEWYKHFQIVLPTWYSQSKERIKNEPF